MDDGMINQVVIVGGGTAGWLTAAKLAKHLGSNKSDAVQVTLIESPDIPTVGVGEGTWPTMRKTLADLDIEEHDFINYCNASFKQATKFVNWRTPAKNGQDSVYYHLFSSVAHADEFNLSPYWSLSDQQIDYANFVSPQALICEGGLAPKTIANRGYDGLLNYAYHLDAGKFADFLKKISCERFGVKHLAANVLSANLNALGEISSIETKELGRIEGDFFVDCTGGRCLLLGEALGVGFTPINDVLFTDNAIAIQVPYQNEEDAISSSTISTAHSAGWTWDIGLSNRRGTGYVYCSDFVSHDQAEQTLRDYIGPQAEQLSARRLKISSGYRNKFWEKNCVAVGMSAAFVEPLEASAIFLIEASANMLCELFPRNKRQLPAVEKTFNDSFHYRWKRTIDFIKLHYFLSQRQESFWLENKSLNSVPESLLEQLDNWKHRPVSKYDFQNTFEPFIQDSYQYVLHGMGYVQALEYNASTFNEHRMLESILKKNAKLKQQLQNNLPTNRDLLNKVRAFGFQKI
ncbi:tryptophan halogenase [Colwellia sp. PAMC 20917]|jgi:tryptophan halogenase|uniref:tryptophan halogenase family protein n=1 Tax=unclassified Colwellia TaxID=196834 RepID=UPI00087A391B|nr:MULTISPECIES: tryptophan halogenase family protein [unclassified Colwellia]AOW77769.1 tryptophan halogenase [Colwellia sp. PAMC 20917]MBA6348154.1 tryptophan 7-halogenase [Colwellia sp. BRX8-9]MBA6351336.1 tryptophan 7-halogenase [Colwellia sp. BRX9-1]MBA6354570.1 tryptophan 7-halogenase [Colwellia sp. BRX8-3]MBA6359017.1 tryptophan 7-halogenase [Colwellia sp. BRX8-6]